MQWERQRRKRREVYREQETVELTNSRAVGTAEKEEERGIERAGDGRAYKHSCSGNGREGRGERYTYIESRRL